MKPTASPVSIASPGTTASEPTLVLNSVATGIDTLGPPGAAAIWVQGCDLACSGCESATTWEAAAGRQAQVADVAAWLGSLSTTNLTISGGEPFLQASILAGLIDQVRGQRDWCVTVYSGFQRSMLERNAPPGSSDLLAAIDVLIDGPFIEAKHAPLLWRGSTNQRIHLLSDRVTLPADRSAGVQAVAADDGSVSLIGVPDQPDAVARIRLAFEQLDMSASTAASTSFPFPTKESTP